MKTYTYKSHTITRTPVTTTQNGRIYRLFAIHWSVCNIDAGRREFITSIAQARAVINDWMDR